MTRDFTLTLINEKRGLHETIDITAGMFILNAAAEADIQLPFLCRTGDCSSCVCKIVSGTVIHTEQTVLSETELQAGYVLTCCAHATSDLILETHKEKELAIFRR